MDVRMLDRNRIIQKSPGGQREPAADVVLNFCVDIKKRKGRKRNSDAPWESQLVLCTAPDEGLIAHRRMSPLKLK